MHTKVMQHADSFVYANAESDLRDIFPPNPGAPRAPWLKKDNSPIPKKESITSDCEPDLEATSADHSIKTIASMVRRCVPEPRGCNSGVAVREVRFTQVQSVARFDS